MLCAECGDAFDAPRPQGRCPSCGSTPELMGRYRLRAILGEGGNGMTYRGERLSDGAAVAIKEMLIRRAESLKTLTLFEREAAVLKQLDHPGIPRYIEDFTHGSGKQLGLYLVQELIDGETLQASLQRARSSERELLRVIAEILDIVAYLHERRPPVIHRDIKPANVMRRRSDGGLVLIDFGAVRDVVKDRVAGGSTVAGTFGFMAPEQFMGRAEPASDIYALGVTLVVLLSRQEPQSLLGHDQRLAWEEAADASPAVERLITAMLEPDPSDRPADARDLAQRIRAWCDGERQTILDGGAAPESSPQTLPVLAPGADLTPPPPQAPRALPADFTNSVTGNEAFAARLGGSITLGIGVAMGGIFTLLGKLVGLTPFLYVGPGLFTLLGIIGGLLLARAHSKDRAARRAYTHGDFVLAEVQNIYLNRNVAGPPQFKLTCSFETGTLRISPTYSGTSSRLEHIRPGDGLYVIFDPDEPTLNFPVLP